MDLLRILARKIALEIVIAEWGKVLGEYLFSGVLKVPVRVLAQLFGAAVLDSWLW